jgi:hypothetical protein
MSTIDRAQTIINSRASWLKQRALLQEQVQESLMTPWQGSFFRADPLTIGLVKTLIDLGLESAVVLDLQQLPCQIDNLKQFLAMLVEHNQQVLNLYQQQYADLVKQRTIK